jgi:PEP-CTERM motif
MKISRIASAVGLVAGLLGAGQAMALNVCVNCLYTAAGPTYLGSLNPTTGDTANFRRENLANTTNATISVTDTWLFDISPAGDAQMTASFNPFAGATTRISGFTSVLRDVTASTCVNGQANSTGTTGDCSGIAFGSLSVNGFASNVGPNQSGSVVFPTFLNAGRYAFQFTYNLAPSNGQLSDYSGQISVSAAQVPEPGTLALAGLALVGVAAAARRNRKA